MEGTENQKVLSSREKMKDRYSKRYPDRDFNAENEQNAIDDLAWEDIEGMESMLGEYETNSKRLVDLFSENPKAGQMFMHMAGGGNPIQYFIENFGDEFIDAMNSEEGKQAFLESHDKWLKKMSDSKKLDEERDANYAKSIEALQAFRDEKGLTDEQAIDVFKRLNQVGEEMVMGIYTPESFQMAYNAMNYDKDVQSAREEGEVNGRNSRIEERLRKGKRPDNMPPSLAGGAADPVSKRPVESKPERVSTWGIPVYRDRK